MLFDCGSIPQYYKHMHVTSNTSATWMYMSYRNFRSFTRMADYPHRPIIAYGEKKKSTDYPHWWITRTLLFNFLVAKTWH